MAVRGQRIFADHDDGPGFDFVAVGGVVNIERPKPIHLRPRHEKGELVVKAIGVLKHQGGMTAKEIAFVLKVSEQHVHQRLQCLDHLQRRRLSQRAKLDGRV